MRNTSYNIHNLIIHDFLQIPKKIRLEKRFCLWKYSESSDSINKFLKIPYGIGPNNLIIPSLKKKQYWFNLSQLNQLSCQIQQQYGLGLVLNDSTYVVIDLDKCITIEKNNLICSNEVKKILNLFPDAYCEISPSNTGLHIIFHGQWLSFNKSKRYIDQHLKIGSIEIYSGNDCRYITLTGNTLNKSWIQNDLPYYSFDSKSLQLLYDQFFTVQKSNNGLQCLNPDKLTNTQNYQSGLFDQYLSIKNKILNSRYVKTYSNLCKLDNPSNKYKSISEADWSYLYLINKFIAQDQQNVDKINLLKYFYQKDRPSRIKKNRADYIDITVKKILISSVFNYQKDEIQQNQLNSFITSANTKPITINRVNKTDILKICNTMNIFHFGRTLTNIEYENCKADNYLKANMPRSLNQTDFRYYIEILCQYIDQLQYCSDIILNHDKFVLININLIFKNLNMSNGGKSYYHFSKSLNKLSDVNLMYDKKITSDGFRSIYKESLISYKILYKQSNQIVQPELLSSSGKLAIKMHPIILDMYKKANYNYSLFNKNSYRKITSDKLKLFYYYFCSLTFPGCNFIKLTIDELLLFWPKTHVKQLVSRRKKEIIRLLKEFIELKSELNDLEIDLIYKQSLIIGVKVKKRQLLLV